MRPKKTWTVPKWSQGSWVEELPEFRKAYGDEIAEAIEEMRDMIRSGGDEPSSQDIKHTLTAIAANPESVNVSRLDGFTQAQLLTVSWKTYKKQVLEALTAQELSHCAEQALSGFQSRPGMPKSDAYAVELIRQLEGLMPADMKKPSRKLLIERALSACDFGYSPKNVERLRTKAGQID